MLFPAMILAALEPDDQEFMKQLYITFQIPMLRMAYAVTSSSVEAEDAVSDAWLSLISKASVLRTLDHSHLEGYMILTVKNAAFSLQRKKARRKEMPLDDTSDEISSDMSIDLESSVLERTSLEELMRTISRLSEEDQMVMRMKFFQHASDREIAIAMGIKKVSVRSRLSRARNRIRRMLQETQNE